MTALGTAQAAALCINLVVDLYFRFKEEGVKVTPENIVEKIKEKEAEIEAREKRLGLDRDSYHNEKPGPDA